MDDRVLLKLAGQYGTPLYVYDGELIARNYRRFFDAFSSRFHNVKIFYACKANTSLAVCSLIRELGAGADVVSAGELKTVIAAGISPDEVLYTSNSKSDSDLSVALEAGVIVNVDSLEELDSLNRIASGLKTIARVSFRINPSISPRTHPKIATGLKESKFGLHIQGGIALKACRKAAGMRSLNVVGVHAHIGSQIQDAGNFVEAAVRVFDFAVELKEKLGLALNFIDLGGGLGVDYSGRGASLSPEGLAEALEPVIRDGFRRLGYLPALVFEPGRYLVAESGVLLTRVNSVKETPYRRFINVDCGFNTLIRPAMYDAFHRVRVLSRKGALVKCDIAGNLCESGDILAKDRMLPKARKGDLIAIMDVGAYGMSMASVYNSQPLPAEVLVRKNKIDLIRQRGAIEDLYMKQMVPEDLQ
jgi:diaminopimelate decarboxylase